MKQAPSPLFPARGGVTEVENGLEFQPNFNENGLIGAVATDAKTGEVLMFAWMNAEALSRTITSREATFWSRSRNRLWKKGEESGNILRVAEIRVDCDQDMLWLVVEPAGNGAACHTGARSCFYRKLDLDGTTEDKAIALERLESKARGS
jgi:phosphoribosyl-AMP cyclohydrolase